MSRFPAVLLCLLLAASCTPSGPPPTQPTGAASVPGGAPRILVAARGGAAFGGNDAMLPLPLPPCTVTRGPVEITVSLDDADGLAFAQIVYGGAILAGSLRETPEGQDITVRRRGAPGREIVELAVADGNVRRTSAVLSFTTAAPHGGSVTVTARDRTGAAARSGPFRLVPSGTEGGCQPPGQ